MRDTVPAKPWLHSVGGSLCRTSNITFSLVLVVVKARIEFLPIFYPLKLQWEKLRRTNTKSIPHEDVILVHSEEVSETHREPL